MIRSCALVVGLIVLRAYLPETYLAFETAMNWFFHLTNTTLSAAPDIMGSQPGSIGEAVGSIQFVPTPVDLPAYLTR